MMSAKEDAWDNDGKRCRKVSMELGFGGCNPKSDCNHSFVGRIGGSVVGRRARRECRANESGTSVADTIIEWFRRLVGTSPNHCGSSVADTCSKFSSGCVSGDGKNDGVCKWHVALTISGGGCVWWGMSSSSSVNISVKK